MKRFALSASTTPLLIYFVNDLNEAVEVAGIENNHQKIGYPIPPLSVKTFYSEIGRLWDAQTRIIPLQQIPQVAYRTSSLASFIEVL